MKAKPTDRRARLRAVADDYFKALEAKNFARIPYHDKVVLRAPLAPGGVNAPLSGREALRTTWWPPLVPAIGKVKVLDYYFNEKLTAVCARALIDVVNITPKVTLRVNDWFEVDANGKITEQENHFDPRDVTNPGWSKS